MAGLEFEPEVAQQPSSQLVEGLRRHLEHGGTVAAHEVLVSVVDEVVHGRPVSEMGMVDDTELLEVIEKSVDRRLVHVRVDSLHVLGDPLRGLVPRQIQEGAEDGATGGGDAAALGSQTCQNLVQPLVVPHGATVPNGRTAS